MPIKVRDYATATLALVLSGCAGISPPTPSSDFDRFSPELPQLLETDALTVLTIGMTNDFAAKVCMRVTPPFGPVVSRETAEWAKRNARFTRGAAAAVNEIANRVEVARGQAAKQSYLNQVLLTTAGKANATILRKLEGANVDNAKVPSIASCTDVADYLSGGAADFDRTPQYTRELSRYMERKAIK